MAERDRNAPKDDVMHGRSLEGASYGATEREQTEDIQRATRQAPDETGEFVTDAEMEAREANGDEDR